jgi:hypothetical protein
MSNSNNASGVPFVARSLAGAITLLFAMSAHATYRTTGYISDLQIDMDNAVTYFRGFTTVGSCAYNRLEFRETGDYFGNVENGRRIYEDTDGPNCRVAEVWIAW